MNRAKRRATRVRGPNGEWLEAQLLRILERDAKGRPTFTRLAYDDETVGEVAGDDRNPQFVMIWVPERDWRPS